MNVGSLHIAGASIRRSQSALGCDLNDFLFQALRAMHSEYSSGHESIVTYHDPSFPVPAGVIRFFGIRSVTHNSARSDKQRVHLSMEILGSLCKYVRRQIKRLQMRVWHGRCNSSEQGRAARLTALSQSSSGFTERSPHEAVGKQRRGNWRML